MIYSEVSKFLNRPEAHKTSSKTTNQFLNQLQRIAHEPPIQVSDLIKKHNQQADQNQFDSEIGGISCLDQSDENNSRAHQSPIVNKTGQAHTALGNAASGNAGN